MEKLTANQAHVLFRIIEYARPNGGQVPTNRKLAEILGITAPMVRKYLKQLGKKLECFQRNGRRASKVNDAVLVTQPDSALYLLIFHQVSETGRVSKTAFHNFLLRNAYRFSLEERLQYILERAVENGYLKVVNSTDYLEPGPHLSETLGYLQLLAGLLVQEEIGALKLSSPLVIEKS